MRILKGKYPLNLFSLGTNESGTCDTFSLLIKLSQKAFYATTPYFIISFILYFVGGLVQKSIKFDIKKTVFVALIL